MKHYIDFTDGLGSDNTIRVDGRLSTENKRQVAEAHAQRCRFINSSNTRTYEFIAGPSLLRAKPVSPEYTVAIDRSGDSK